MEASLPGHGRRCACAPGGRQLHHHLRWEPLQGASQRCAWEKSICQQHLACGPSICCFCLDCPAEPCTPGGACLPGSSNVLHTLDMGRLAYAFYVQPNAVLRMSNVQLFDLAPGAAFRDSSATPWRSTGQGVTTWPSIGLAPNATVCAWGKTAAAAAAPVVLACLQPHFSQSRTLC